MSSASAQLDSQIMKMQEAADELQGEISKVSAVKESVKAKSMLVEAARIRRAELETIRSSKVDEVEDPRYAGLYDWFVSFLPPSVKAKAHFLGKGTPLRSLSTNQFSVRKPSTQNPKTSCGWYM